MAKWEKVGKIGVDAGLCWVGDPCYILDPRNPRPKDLGRDWAAFCDKVQDYLVTQFKYDRGHRGLGVCVSTGHGDGAYDVEARFVDTPRGGRLVAEIRVVFIDDEG